MFLLGRELTGSRVGRRRRRPRVRVLAVPHRVDPAPAGAVVGVDAVRPLRPAATFPTGRLRPLAGAAAAWIAQNLSCGYYLLFFSPVVAPLHRLGADDAPAVEPIDGTLAARPAARVRGGASSPRCRSCCRMLELRRLGFSPRSLTETKRFSADVYATSPPIPTCGSGAALRARGRRLKGCSFPG